MNSSITMYPLDLTGSKTSNLVLNELHEIGNRNERIIFINYAPFFKTNLRLNDYTTGRQLVEGEDYIVIELPEVDTLKAGSELGLMILIVNSAISPNVLVSYQTLGGDSVLSAKNIHDLYKSLTLNTQKIQWKDIVGKPKQFMPLPHLHDAQDVYGYEYIVEQIRRINDLMLQDKDTAHDEIKDYIDDTFNSKTQDLSSLLEEHKQSGDHDPRYFLKDQMDERYILLGEALDISLDGPTTIYQGVDSKYKITNFDTFSTYTVNSPVGVCSVVGDTINFRVNLGVQFTSPVKLNVIRDGVPREIFINVIAQGISPPNITIATGDNVCNLLQPTITLSGFTAIPANSDTIKSTDIQISTDPKFNTIFWQRMGDTNSSTRLTVKLPKLSVQSRYYIRARFNGNMANNVGDWSVRIISTHRLEVVKKQVTQNTTYAYQYNTSTTRTTYYNSAVSRSTSYSRTTSVSVVGYGPTTTFYHGQGGQGAMPTPYPASARPNLVSINNLNKQWATIWLVGGSWPDTYEHRWKGFVLATSSRGSARNYEESRGDVIPSSFVKIPYTSDFMVYPFDGFAPAKYLYGWWERRIKSTRNSTYVTRWSESSVSYVPTSRQVVSTVTIGSLTSTITQFNTKWPIGRFTQVQKLEQVDGLNTTFIAFTGYLRFTTKLTTRTTSWVINSPRNTTRQTSWFTYLITSITNPSNYTCHGGVF